MRGNRGRDLQQLRDIAAHSNRRKDSRTRSIEAWREQARKDAENDPEIQEKIQEARDWEVTVGPVSPGTKGLADEVITVRADSALNAAFTAGQYCSRIGYVVRSVQ